MNKRWFNSLLMFAWLTIGYGAVHVVALLWVIGIAQALFRQPQTYEHLQITTDLEPLIVSRDGASNRQVYRRLDGTKLESKPGFGPKFLGSTSITPNSNEESDEWKDRICGLNDCEDPAVYWYFVAPPSYAGTGFFTGYEELSRDHIGYIDREGFTKELPTPERSFPVKIATSWAADLPGTLAGPQLFNHQNVGLREPNLAGHWIAPVANVAHDTVWLHSQDKIYEIHLNARTVKTLIENRPDILLLGQQIVYQGRTAELRLVVRTTKGVSIIDPKTGQEKSLPFEGGQAGDWQALHSTETIEGPHSEVTRYVIVTGKPWRGADHPRTETISWLDGEGNVERQENVKLLNPGEEFANISLGMTVCVPLPLGSIATIVFGPIVAPTEISKSETYAGRVLDWASYFRMYLIVSILVGLVTGWVCRRRERDVFGNASWFWPVLVGACGWFGWIGYICLRPLPARLPNHAWITATPEPASLIGTEIFA